VEERRFEHRVVEERRFEHRVVEERRFSAVSVSSKCRGFSPYGTLLVS
jgi:hypothetical protein